MVPFKREANIKVESGNRLLYSCLWLSGGLHGMQKQPTVGVLSLRFEPQSTTVLSSDLSPQSLCLRSESL